MRKNPSFPRRRKLLPIITENKSITPPEKDNSNSLTCRCAAVSRNYTRLIRIPTTDNLNGLYTHEDKSKSQYVPVYNNREIYTVCNTFSSFNIDKKLYDMDYIETQKSTLLNSRQFKNNVTVHEAVNNKGYGNFVYV